MRDGFVVKWVLGVLGRLGGMIGIGLEWRWKLGGGREMDRLYVLRGMEDGTGTYY